MKRSKLKTLHIQFRKNRTRARILGTAQRPRLSVFRSNRYIYAQLIDDEAGKTLAALSNLNEKSKVPKAEAAKAIGKKIAGKAKALGIRAAIFDRGAYKYHGRIKALAEGAREGGLKF